MQSKFTVVDYPEPHLQRTREILKKHPEMRKLFGNTPSSALWITALVALQIGVAIALRHQPIWVIVLAAWIVGAVADHALWVMIHECTHNLVFKGSFANQWLQIFANLPIFYPSAITFRTFHLQHHRYQGEPNRDADLAIPLEAAIAGANPVGKATWLLLFAVFQPLRVQRLREIQLFNRWVVANWIVEVAFLAGLWIVAGPLAVLYLFLSGSFAVGLHPVGARWIQEHYVVSSPQETYSYYGPLNKVAFNVGYHNEHHDLMVVPWSRLPQVRAMAPEYYDTLVYHRSWTGLLLKFLFDPTLTLNSRIIREPRGRMSSLSTAPTAAEAGAGLGVPAPVEGVPTFVTS